MSKLREKMKMDLELRGYSRRSVTSYLKYVKQYALHFSTSPELLDEDEVREFLHYLITEKKVCTSYVNGTYSAIRFLYETTLGLPWDMKIVPRVKNKKKLPIVLSIPEIKKIFSVTTNLKHKAMFMTAYGAGLRVSELANLKISDIDSNNMQILVRQGKGSKDRYSILSQTNLRLQVISLAELQDIFKAFGEQYRQKYSLSLHHLKAMSAIEQCRTASLGGHVNYCEGP